MLEPVLAILESVWNILYISTVKSDFDSKISYSALLLKNKITFEIVFSKMAQKFSYIMTKVELAQSQVNLL